MAQISDVLREANTWWNGHFELDYKERQIYGRIKEFMPEKQILAFTGLRRVGKTTLLLKIIDDSIKSGTDPLNIVFFSFDELITADIRDIIREYELITGKSISQGKHLLVLDEIQKLEGWEGKLKWIYDVYSRNVKILISGSESLFIRKKSKETLSGRLLEFKITPLTFKEFVDFKGQKAEPIGIYEHELERAMPEFMRTQGFPELVGKINPAYIKKYITEGISDKVLYKDIPEMFGIRNTDALGAILRILMDAPGQVIDYAKLAKELGISRYSVSKYLGYLEDAFIVRKMYNYSRNIRKSERSLRKYYPTIISTELAFKDDALYQSKVFEWMVVNQLDAKYFWRDEHHNEVDIVLEKGPIPIEIKYGGIDTTGLNAFMRKFKSRKGYIVSAHQDTVQRSQGKTINIVPAFKLLLKQNILLE